MELREGHTYQAHIRVHEHTFEDRAGDERGLVSCSEKEGDKGKDDDFAEFLDYDVRIPRVA
jgi:hypothetical protein